MKAKPRRMSVKDRIGQRVGRLMVVARGPNKVEGNAIRACWVCVCDCGVQIIVQGKGLDRGSRPGVGGTRSCGCLKKDKPIKHGKSHDPIYKVWVAMRARCDNPNNESYARYGGRGIKVCEAWVDFEKFYADMGDPPEGYTLERDDNDGNYELSNCRWATRAEQANNQSNNRILTFRGEQKTAAEWAASTGLGKHCLLGRLKLGWSIEDTLTRPKQFQTRKPKGRTSNVRLDHHDSPRRRAADRQHGDD